MHMPITYDIVTLPWDINKHKSLRILCFFFANKKEHIKTVRDLLLKIIPNTITTRKRKDFTYFI